MPEFDMTAAKRELAGEAEPIGMSWEGVGRYEFPGSMPAEVEIEQRALQRELRDLPDGAPAPAGSQERLMKAVFGQFYEELEEKLGQVDLMAAMGTLMSVWMEAWQDPNLLSRLRTLGRKPSNLTTSSSGSSSSTSEPSRLISPASTASISPEPSGVPNGSPGAGSSPSSRGSRPRR
jgi:hypothetical protein